VDDLATDNSNATQAWYALSGSEVLEQLDSSAEGITETAASSRFEDCGPNELSFSQTPAWLRFLRQFNDPMVIILLVTAVVTATLTALGSHMLPDTLVITAVVLLNAILGFVQEGKAEGALQALRDMMVQECMVVRDGEQRRIEARELVPGDLVLLESGDKVPADIRFLEINNAYVDESSLTGESIPVLKLAEDLPGRDLVPGDQRNMGFSGTYITRGTARAVVVATGSRTVFGHIAAMVQAADAGLTPLQRNMKDFVRTLIFIILVVGTFNFAYGVYLGYEIAYSFLGAVSLVVAAIPEMLPALVTSILALSGVVMAGRKALIRRLPAAETLGATSVICSDKTGTLTENRMTVTRVYAGSRTYEVTGVGHDIEGSFLLEGEPRPPRDEPALSALLYCGFHCNNAHLGATHGTGDPTELALRVSGAKSELVAEGVLRLEEIPFDSSVRFMAVLVKTGDRHLILLKGAPEVVVPLCTGTLDAHGEVAEFDPGEALRTAGGFAGDALRTLAFAQRELPSGQVDLRHEELTGMCFLGLQGMIDPPRESAVSAVAKCKAAGIRTVMITGDHPDTAQAVARQLGLQSQRVVTGAELSRMDDTGLRDCAAGVSVFARVAPEHKKAIAEALRAQGEVVAMTGDGVNDAPALKAADIGVAMGISGTEVARESADMVLADDNFDTIVAAVEEGRHAWNNLQKAILYTLPTNAAQALLIMGAILIAAAVPLFATRFVLESVQILWINLLDSVLLTMPLMLEHKERGLLDAPPRKAGAQIINRLFIERVVVMGLAIALPCFFIYYHFGAAALGADGSVDALLLSQAQTAAFWAILFAHIGYVISARSIHHSAFSFNPFSNRWLLLGIALSVVMHTLGTYLPGASYLFRTAPFPTEWWPLVVLCFLPSFIAIEADKLIRRIRLGSAP
jgi:calcium-translocating P-type ATPase